VATFPVDDFFVPELTSPATFTPAGGAASEIDVLFEREAIDSQIAGERYVNGTPRATCKKRDVAGAKAGDSLLIHGFLEVNDNTILADGQGNALLVPRIGEYLVHTAHPDETGLTELILTTDA
jgi:hypothetical protein